MNRFSASSAPYGLRWRIDQCDCILDMPGKSILLAGHERALGEKCNRIVTLNRSTLFVEIQ